MSRYEWSILLSSEIRLLLSIFQDHIRRISKQLASLGLKFHLCRIRVQYAFISKNCNNRSENSKNIIKFFMIISIPCLVLSAVNIFRVVSNSFDPASHYPNPIAFLYDKIAQPFSNFCPFHKLNCILDNQFYCWIKLSIRMKQAIEKKIEEATQSLEQIIDRKSI